MKRNILTTKFKNKQNIYQNEFELNFEKHQTGQFDNYHEQIQQETF